MRKEIKEKRRALINEQFEKSPTFGEGRKLVFNLLVTIVFMRIFAVALEVVCLAMYNFPIRVRDIYLMVMQILVVLFFTRGIYSGIKGFIYLILMFHSINLLSMWTMGLLLGKNIVLLDIEIIVYTIEAFAQMAAMIFFCKNKRCGMYLDAMQQIREDLEWVDSNYQ